MKGKLEFIKLLTRPKRSEKEKHWKARARVYQTIGNFSLAIFFSHKKAIRFGRCSRGQKSPYKKNAPQRVCRCLLSSYVNKVIRKLFPLGDLKQFSSLSLCVWMWMFFFVLCKVDTISTDHIHIPNDIAWTEKQQKKFHKC